MKQILFILTLLLFLSSGICNAQKCKYPNKMRKIAQKHFKEAEITRATKFKPIFKKFSKAGTGFFVQSDKGYYLGFVLVRELGVRIDLNDDNPIQLQFVNDSILTLYPDKSIPGKFTLPVMTEYNKAYYKVDENQINLLASNSIKHIKIYYTLQKETSDYDRTVDDLGMFIDFEVLKENYQSNLIEIASCILK
ncbi:hypothetical protein FEE95_09040 [Maribacter algarum]|uniref:DUF4384 domain-containing protein n=1 Tax=Maribacter algarum (ex Zhang et al. 2020) TaxID=2578118 RepID=A0A5S3PPT2_9FLAO|nr:hypothetical protein [Maribacter algarum]TMM56639.1 hypothetical protein FEE95_09040 [Maribacter algarum]